MNRDRFVDGYLEKMIVKDKEIGERFAKSDETEKARLKDVLRDSLGHSYDAYAKNYFDDKGLGNYASTFLRWSGAGADVAGSYLFFALGGAGFGLKGIGFAEKTIADLIDSRRWAKHTKELGLTEKLSDDAKISAELIAERAGAYYLPFAGVVDLLRGRSKYDSRVTERTLQYAKNNFLDYAKRTGNVEYKEKEPKIISLDNFRNTEYVEPKTIKLKDYDVNKKAKAA